MTEFKDFTNSFDTKLFDKFFIKKLYNEIDFLIKASLEEDLGENGDVTSRATLTERKAITANIIAKQEGIFSGGFIVRMVFNTIDKAIKTVIYVQEGQFVHKNNDVISITGPAESVLTGERTALNFLSRTSGVSTLTNKFVDVMKGSNIKILDTRKTCPGWRYLDKYAVKLGGGFNHRIGLFDMILIKDNHITTAGGIKNAVKACREFLYKNKLELKIEVETKNLEEVSEALEEKVNRIMLDNMTIDKIKKAVSLINKSCEIEISGGVKSENIKDYYNTGVDFISIGEITHSAKVFDYSLLIN